MRDFSTEIDQSLDLLFKIKNLESTKKELIEKRKTLYLQIRLFKTPFVSASTRKFLKLKHSIFGDDPEICLFVPNRKTGVSYKKSTEELIDFCVEYYSKLLEKNRITQIKTIIPLKQLKTEYSAYELRRKLAHRFDIFLCKNSLLRNPKFLSGLGKIFRGINKEPLGISFPKNEENFDPRFKKNVKRAICTTAFYIKPFSDNYTIPFGTLSHTVYQLKENLKAVLDQILDIIPGGLNNVRAMYLWPSQSKTIPFYFCPNLPNKLASSHLKPLKKNKKKKNKNKNLEIVQDEISTQPGKRVTVMPNGDVFVTNDFSRGHEHISNGESEDSFSDTMDVEENSQTVQGISQGNEDDSESENDELIEKMEKRLMGKRESDKSYSFDTVAKKRNKKSDEKVVEAKKRSKKLFNKSKNKKLKKKFFSNSLE